MERDAMRLKSYWILLNLLAFLVGLLQFLAAIGTIFIFRNDELVSLWCFMFSGPMVGFLVAVLMIFNLRFSAYCYWSLGVINTIVLIWVALESHAKLLIFVQLFITYPMPLLVIGALGLMLMNKFKEVERIGRT